MNYPYASIKLIDGKVKAVCNVKEEPHAITSMACIFINELYRQWQQNHKVFEFANEDEIIKVAKHLVNKGTPDNYNLLYNGIETTCIEIKDGFSLF